MDRVGGNQGKRYHEITRGLVHWQYCVLNFLNNWLGTIDMCKRTIRSSEAGQATNGFRSDVERNMAVQLLKKWCRNIARCEQVCHLRKWSTSTKFWQIKPCPIRVESVKF